MKHMQKRTIFLLFIVMITLSFPTYSFAQVETSPTTQVEDSLKDRVKNFVENKRTNQKEHMENRKLHIESVKDEYKRTLLTRINDHLQTIHSKHVSRLGDAVDKLNTMHEKLSLRVEKKQEEGIDVTTALTALETAQTSIDAAESAVSVQESKDYTLAVSDETHARIEVSTVIQQMKADMKTSVNAVKKAKEDLIKAVKIIAQLE